MNQQDILRVLAAGVLSVAFLAMLIVLTYDLIVRPDAMIPTVVTTVVGAVVGYAASILGVQQGVNQTISSHTYLNGKSQNGADHDTTNL